MDQATEACGPRILIVDDQKSNVRLLEQTLRRAGFAEVTSTLEPRDVAALHREHQYDLILLDLQMPQMNGFEVMEQLQQASGADRLKILVLSADASQGPAALKAGANSFFGKPFRLPEVVERVRLVLKKDVPEPNGGFSAAAPTLLQ
jgi:CheY-like chemotaxis protein